MNQFADMLALALPAADIGRAMATTPTTTTPHAASPQARRDRLQPSAAADVPAIFTAVDAWLTERGTRDLLLLLKDSRTHIEVEMKKHIREERGYRAERLYKYNRNYHNKCKQQITQKDASAETWKTQPRVGTLAGLAALAQKLVEKAWGGGVDTQDGPNNVRL